MSDTFNQYRDRLKEVGFVRQIIKTIVLIEGLPNARQSELVIFENGQTGYVFGMKEDYVEVALLDYPVPSSGTEVVRTDITVAMEVKGDLGGRKVDMFVDLDLKDTIDHPGDIIPVDKNPKSIGERIEIVEPLVSEINSIDLLQPLGQGQRELIIGDRASGKTTTAMQILKSQAKQGVKCIYCIVGKRTQEIDQIYGQISNFEAKENITLMAASAHEPIGKIVMTPTSAMSVAEYFADQGYNALVVFDDLTIQAKFYREMALLSGNFPGKESYPGDVFHLHAKLLERAGKFRHPKGAVSITALPICESYGGNISGFIQTNLMSITDGHLHFDSEYFFKGIRPSLNPFYSVTRVGRQTQTPIRQKLSQLALELLHNYENALEFSKFGADVAEKTKNDLSVGERFWKILVQSPNTFVPHNLQLFFLGAIAYSQMDPKTIWTYLDQYNQDQSFRQQVDALAGFEEIEAFKQAFLQLIPNQKTQKDPMKDSPKGPKSEQSPQESSPVEDTPTAELKPLERSSVTEPESEIKAETPAQPTPQPVAEDQASLGPQLQASTPENTQPQVPPVPQPQKSSK